MAIKRLPWTFEGKKHVVHKSEWNDFVCDIEKKLVADLNKELDVTNQQLAEALDRADKAEIQLREANNALISIRKITKVVKRGDS